jgi:hypothetical protein
MAATLRGRFVEAEPAGREETTGFSLEDVTIVESDPEGPSDLQTATVNLDMPSAVSAENWAGKEVNVEGHFEEPPPGEGSHRSVFVVEHIDEV